ncbi:hypothetical protein [Stenotrophomonas maltophilia]|uniref:hypothetical protein n=1 Tax=Stenotrophomonas maltophilia TaxID=40324 RepID=UPI0034D5F036
MLDPATAERILHNDARRVIDEINAFTSVTFNTRGGRLGSGMGSLLEAMWVYYMNRVLQNSGGEARLCELAWLQDHEPADFACIVRGAPWEPASREGELFRIEAKSMNIGVDEAKGHFANLRSETGDYDQLLVLIWSWTTNGFNYSWPRIHDYFLGPALPIIALRDELHVKRGGTFVNACHCPDGCVPGLCPHAGEPLNASGKRERRSGPKTCRPLGVDYAANFGGLLRMLKTDSADAREKFRDMRSSNMVAHEYISFIHEHYPSEEVNQYLKSEWQQVLRRVGLPVNGESARQVNDILRDSVPGYREVLRDMF